MQCSIGALANTAPTTPTAQVPEMQLSTEIVQPQVPVVQIYISGRSLIRLYQGEKCVGFSETYKFARIRAEELEKTDQKRELH